MNTAFPNRKIVPAEVGSAVLAWSGHKSSSKSTRCGLRLAEARALSTASNAASHTFTAHGFVVGFVFFFFCIVHPFYCVQIYVSDLRNCKLHTPESFPVLLDPPHPNPLLSFFVNEFYSFPPPPFPLSPGCACYMCSSSTVAVGVLFESDDGWLLLSL